MEEQIQLKQVKKQYEGSEEPVIENLNLTIRKGSFTILLGPSGCGKSTTLRMIAGLEALSEGELDIEGQDMDGVAPRDRDVAMVFQNYALYPTMNVRDNIEFGLKNAKVPKAEREHRIREVCDMTGLTEYLRRKPGALSGGQRQRVALARAMVKHPSIFLMDEPLSNLDAKLRSQLRSDLIELHHKMNATFIYVTHDQIEAMSMGTDIVLMNQGKIMQQGSPEEIYHTPQNVFTARFIGSPAMNVFPCSRLDLAGKPENAAYVGVRPEHLSIFSREESIPKDAALVLEGRVLTREMLGSETLYKVETEVGPVQAKVFDEHAGCSGTVTLVASGDNLHWFDQKEGRI